MLLDLISSSIISTFYLLLLGLILILWGIMGNADYDTAKQTTITHHHAPSITYYDLPRFWTNSGLCPFDELSLLSPETSLNFQYIASLPKGAITHLRIHWLLNLLEFEDFTQQGIPIYDYDNLDKLITLLNDLGLSPAVEFMGNPGHVFEKNPNANDIMWESMAYGVVKHYLSE